MFLLVLIWAGPHSVDLLFSTHGSQASELRWLGQTGFLGIHMAAKAPKASVPRRDLTVPLFVKALPATHSCCWVLVSSLQGEFIISWLLRMISKGNTKKGSEQSSLGNKETAPCSQGGDLKVSYLAACWSRVFISWEWASLVPYVNQASNWDESDWLIRMHVGNSAVKEPSVEKWKLAVSWPLDESGPFGL